MTGYFPKLCINIHNVSAHYIIIKLSLKTLYIVAVSVKLCIRFYPL